jgi:hypothetical protein
MADRVDASIQEIRDRLGGTHGLNAQLIHRIALRGAGETVRDAMVHGNAMRTFCEDVLATDEARKPRP